MDIAHVKILEDGTWAEPQLLKDHLMNTAQMAADFAKKFASEAHGQALGHLHDAGKSTQEWQKYLRSKSGYDTEAHLEKKQGRVEHSIHGALLAEELFGKGIGRMLGYAIAGHHAGLPDWHPDQEGGMSALSYRLNSATVTGVDPEIINAARVCNPLSVPWKCDPNNMDLSMWIRMLYSCLVDADFLDTEMYMQEEKTAARGGFLSIPELLGRFNSYMAQKIADAEKTNVNKIRNSILSDCRKAGKSGPGFFSLTVPTGGGKTLSSLAFALEHAVKNGFERVIYVIPYTSIIEQNADVFRDVLGNDQVVEHHSAIEEDETTPQARLAAENWDAPVIVTTTVQFFESLFAAKPGRCRKLHNIVGSVVILDEAQLLPVKYLAPILQMMTILQERYHVTFVISTATQPAFETRNGFKGLPEGRCREIISDVPGLYKALQRTTIIPPSDWQAPVSWEEIATMLRQEKSVLCVVSDRKSCRELYTLMPEGTYHLSALMCGQHRSDVIAEVKQKLQKGEIVRVISTQLVEAGVDFDFPVVYRALAGLDSIIQAAGRCNREGTLEMGKVVLFVAPRKAPPGILRKAAETTMMILRDCTLDGANCAVFERFFSELYWKANSLDEKGIVKLLTPDAIDCGMQFRTAASKFRIIDDTQFHTVIVKYGSGSDLIERLIKKGPDRQLFRKLQRYVVNIYSYDFIKMRERGSITEIIPGVFALVSPVEYDKDIGLLVDEITGNPERLYL